MGVDLYLIDKPCKTCGHQEEHESFYCTYNLSPMWKVVYPGECLLQIDNLTSDKALKKIIKMQSELIDHKSKFLELNPSNGFGTYDGFLNLINELIDECVKYPKAVWRVWR